MIPGKRWLNDSGNSRSNLLWLRLNNSNNNGFTKRTSIYFLYNGIFANSRKWVENANSRKRKRIQKAKPYLREIARALKKLWRNQNLQSLVTCSDEDFLGTAICASGRRSEKGRILESHRQKSRRRGMLRQHQIDKPYIDFWSRSIASNPTKDKSIHGVSMTLSIWPSFSTVVLISEVLVTPAKLALDRNFFVPRILFPVALLPLHVLPTKTRVLSLFKGAVEQSSKSSLIEPPPIM
ncbi:hypothetical protein Ccrd_022355 [Cynara cardunculus var. scolymus]|uniref:Uncharacterized protein n=1 Tax=Cynara cardunculus var. scolymus TaxID=59895 RepID=A0A103XYU0_CYNCS|nr:hypothetical protein Ccrd_022355 [Cynara cardunculus var. scolymus]